MKFRTTKKDLQAALKLAGPAINNKSHNDLIKCVWIQAKDGSVVIRATDFTISVVVPLANARVSVGGGDRLVKFKELAAVTSTFDPEATIEFDGSEPTLRVHAGSTRVDLPVFSLSDFPTLPELAEGGQAAVTLPDEKFAELVRLGGYARGDELSRPLLTQAMLEHTGDNVRLLTTNAHRLAAASWATGEAATDRQEFILPPYAAQLAAKMFEGQGISIRRSLNHVQFNAESGRQLTISVMDGTYPNVDAVTPKRGDGSVATFNVAGLVSAANLVRATCFDIARMKLSFDGPQVVVTGGDDAKVLDILAVSGSTFDEGFEAIFNAQYLVDALSRWPTETVEIQMDDPERQARLDLPPGHNLGIDHMAMVVPMRLLG